MAAATLCGTRTSTGPGQVLVKVAGTSFNPVDAGIRGGYLAEVFAITLPHVPMPMQVGWPARPCW